MHSASARARAGRKAATAWFCGRGPTAPGLPPRPPGPAAAPAPAGDVSKAQTASGATSGYDKLTVSLRAMPKQLQNMSQSFKG